MICARLPRWLAPALTPAIAAAIYLGLPTPEAEAAKPQRGGGFDEGGYIMLTPGSLVLPFAEDDFTDLDPSFGWGFGGGYMFARGELFKATLGASFEHTVLVLDDYDFKDFGVHVLRFMPEARIGLGTNKIWGYGLFGAGVAGALWFWDFDVPFLNDINGDDSAVGFNVQFGGGVQGIVYKNLFLGGEIDFDLGLFYEGDAGDWRGNADDDFSIFQVAFEFTIGWYF
ncbi:hypothetical protein ENSA5_56530 [Enhygromyxa salina]|uniref:Outer membrane protein beta-barrel domain-containing protein n=1 Tax=Enhygromyxa salina TaxID=215803 RepID=A0A2S9XEL3_9BACT|nr:hypothetical protein [Enhygromyxa salina]PRP91304.1 hypothetical protein ENSA5_56530 [Enhygromyxa salina]